METSRSVSFSLTEQDESDIILFYEIARANGATLSLVELLKLTSLRATEEELTSAWRGSELLESKYVLKSGLILEKEHAESEFSKKEEDVRKARARGNIAYSKKFAALCKSRSILTLAISGSTSYLSVSESDDLDFFTITRREAVWLFLTKSLILSRLQNLILSKSPDVCMSYTVDERYADREFTAPRNGLFARDALTILPLLGSAYYQKLLARSSWMSKYFPKLYRSRLSRSKGDVARSIGTSSFLRVANMFLYFTIGRYIRMKSWILNRKFAKWGKFDRLFHLNIGPDHCIYEARSYVDLRHIYSKMRSGSTQVHPASV